MGDHGFRRDLFLARGGRPLSERHALMTDSYAVFGNPVGHSKSPFIHQAFARATGQDLSYDAIELPSDGFAQGLAEFIARGGKGCNITVPFKLDAFAAATERRPGAELAGASNCLKIEGERIIAENFDGIGLLTDIQCNLGLPLADLRVLLLGAGGAVRGVLKPFLDAAPAAMVVANRTETKARDLAAVFSAHGPVTGAGYDGLAGQSFDVVVNGTSASLTGDRLTLPDTAFAPGCLAYDMVYGKGLTPFLIQARAAGAVRLADGVGMLVEQAAEAFDWWRGVRPDTAPLIGELTVPLT